MSDDAATAVSARIGIDASGAAAGAEVASRSFQQIADAARRAGEPMRLLGPQTNTSFKQVGAGADHARARVGALSATVRQMVYAFGLWKAYQFAKDAVMVASRYEELGIVIREVGQRTGITASSLNRTDNALRKYGIAATESRQVILKFMQAHLDLAKATELARVAQDAAVVGGLNSSQTLQRITHGIVSGQTEVLRTVGITVQFEQAYRKLAKEVGVSEQALTSAQRTQARMNAVMEEGSRLSGAYEASMQSASKQMRSWPRYIEDIKVALGEAFGDELRRAVFAISKAMVEVAKHLRENGPLIAGVAKAVTIIGGFGLAIYKLGPGMFALQGAIMKAGGSLVWFTKTLAAAKLAVATFFSGPVGWIIAAVAAVGTGVALYAGYRKKLEAEAERARKALTTKEVDKFSDALERLAKLPGKIALQGLTDQAKALSAELSALYRNVPKTVTVRTTSTTAKGDGSSPWLASSFSSRPNPEFERQRGAIEQKLRATGALIMKVNGEVADGIASSGEEAVNKFKDLVKELDAYERKLATNDPFFEVRERAREMGEAFVESGKAAGKSSSDIEGYLVRLGAAMRQEIGDEQKKQLTEIGKAMAEATAERLKASATNRQEIADMNGLVAALKLGEHAVEAYTKRVAERQRMEELVASGLTVAEARERVVAERRLASMQSLAEEARAWAAVRDAQDKQAAETVEAYERETAATLAQAAALKGTTKELRAYNIERQAQALVQQNDRLSLDDARRVVKAKADADELLARIAQARDEAEQIRKNMTENIQRSLGGLFEGIFERGLRSWRDFMASIKSIFTTTIAQMLASAVVKRLMDFLRGAGGGATAGSMAGMATLGMGGVTGMPGIPVTLGVGKQGGGFMGMQPMIPGTAGAWAQGAGGALAGGMIGYSLGYASGNKTTGVLGGMAGGAAAGAAMGGLPGAIVGGIVGGVAGWFGASKKAKETAKQLAEAQKEFSRALDDWHRAATKTKSAVTDELRQLEAQRDALRKQANEAMPGKKLEGKRNAALNQIEQDYGRLKQQVVENYRQGLVDAIESLKGDDWSAQFRAIETRYKEYQQAALEGFLDPSMVEEWYRLAKKKIEEAQRQQLADLQMSFDIRRATVSGNDAKAAQLTIEAQRDREIAGLKALADAGTITTAMFEEFAAVVRDEATKALEDYTKAVAEQKKQTEEDLKLREMIAREVGEKEIEQMQLEVAHRRELVGITDEAIKAQLLYVQGLEREALAKAQAKRDAEKAEGERRVREALELRTMRANGATEDEIALRELEIAQRQELAGITDEALKASYAYVHALEAEALAKRQAEAAAQRAEDRNLRMMAATGATDEVLEAERIRIAQRRELLAAASEEERQELIKLHKAEDAWREQQRAAVADAASKAAQGSGGASITTAVQTATVAQADRMISLLAQIAANTATFRLGGSVATGASPSPSGVSVDTTLGSAYVANQRLSGRARVEIA